VLSGASKWRTNEARSSTVPPPATGLNRSLPVSLVVRSRPAMLIRHTVTVTNGVRLGSMTRIRKLHRPINLKRFTGLGPMLQLAIVISICPFAQSNLVHRQGGAIRCLQSDSLAIHDGGDDEESHHDGHKRSSALNDV
jgi:hypothetical protein